MSAQEDRAAVPSGAAADLEKTAFTRMPEDLARHDDPETSLARRVLVAVVAFGLVASGVVAAGFLTRSSPFRDSENSKVAPIAVPVSLLPTQEKMPARTTASAASGPSTSASPSASPSKKSPNPQPARNGAGKATFAAIAGAGCSRNDDSHGWNTVGYYTQGTEGWYEIRGGYAGDGCDGRAVALPMSGDTNPVVAENYVVWWFNTAPVTEGTCQFSIYVPDSGTPRDVAGNPAVYRVLSDRNSTTAYATFNIIQPSRRGSWIAANGVPVHNGGISVQLLDTGTDPNHEHIGAAQVKVNCTGA